MKVDIKIKDSLDKWRVEDEYSETMVRYLVHGLPPGSGFEAFLIGDLHLFLARSHPSNTVKSLKELSGWVCDCVPCEARGSKEAVDRWCKLTQEDRNKVLIAYGLQSTPWDVLKSKEPTQVALGMFPLDGEFE